MAVVHPTNRSLDLSPFIAETAHTIFLSGTLYLHSPSYPLDKKGVVLDVGIEELQSIITQHRGWILQHPELR